MAELLQYLRIDGPFHRMNALVKITFIVLVIIMAVVSTDPAVLAALVAVLFILSVAGRFARELLRQVPMLIVLSAGLLLLTVLTMQGGETVASLIPPFVPGIGGFVPITTGAITFAMILSLRFFAMLFAFQLMIISTQPRDLVEALRKLRLPMDYTLMLLIAIRFIPSLQLEGKRIQEAQRARAYYPGAGVTGKVKALTPIIIPLVSNALGKANVLGLTIDLRGLRSMQRTPSGERAFGAADCGLIAVAVVLVAAFVAIVVL
ncbi:MAG: energy-coupling factor transporter transmembrane protein EcfT [Methanomicrobiaceae archaeon]|nr:energy-coupling factor transporter transmembrane protein EcfT [Methanomicrobiaceae archaeon]